MLKNIPAILSPDILKAICEMGHGDEIVLAGRNFPAASHAQKLKRADGHTIPDLLDALLYLFPLDTYVDKPVTLMKEEPGDLAEPKLWDEYSKIINNREEKDIQFEWIDRFAFYDRAKRAFAIIATGEKAPYANLILKKGVIKT
jgi:L-fucose mutarotase